MSYTKWKKINYDKIANEVRKQVLTLIYKAQTSHIGSNFSVIDLAVFINENLKPEDRMVWSKGWAAATAYTLLKRRGIITQEQLESFPKEPFIGLTEMSVPGIETAGGSMGHGLPVGVGMALGLKRANESGRVFVIMSDGEMQEGTTWEGALVAAHHQLDNLTVVIDYNKWCAMGRTNEVCNLEPLEKKWEAFGWRVWEVDGHDYKSMDSGFSVLDVLWTTKKPETLGKSPKVVIAHTTKGKGISFMEDYLLYHYKYISDDEYKKAMVELT